ncbi:MAG TPA: hypothetical protein VJU85_03880 [Nitrososphaeraceae archaeon]|nr:hypothetical protein [Nitrososphaeraceae archaeon]
MKLDAYTKSTLAFLVILSLSISIIHFENAKAQTISSTDPKKVLKEFKTGKDAIQNDIQINFNQLINEVKSQLNFSAVDSHLSLASQNFINGRISEGLSELKSANEEWKNSSMTIIKIGSDFISIAKNNSTSMNESTKEILDNFGNILINSGKKIENLRIQLSN